VNLDPDRDVNRSSPASINNKDEIVGTATDWRAQIVAVRFARGHVIPLIQEVTNLGAWTQLNYATVVNDKGEILGTGDKGHFLLVPNGR
jgi:hypothetical protein